MVDREETMRLRTLLALVAGAVMGAIVVLRSGADGKCDADDLIERAASSFREHAPRGLAAVVEQVTRWALAVGTIVVRQAVKAARNSSR